MFKKILICVFYFTLLSPLSIMAEDNNNEVDYQYYPLNPDIITNYVKVGKRIGFVRISAELLVNSKNDFSLVEKHAPLIRDRIITGEHNEKEIKSAAEREEIRLRCLLEINDVVAAITGTRPIQDLFFTTFLYQ